ncbi:MAG: multifunctional CCA addition/repair protein [Paraglaciecola sp.]|uniref:multifunctional CCA addition/repair protein n=1 Tax=Paraglaciecola sp. TaxID=1920173 RepID=UPI00273F0F74|nr:multifunctional CCA addition/repair protein [Paraglaciecola sp.]MDP5030223.1 multifunctional CCA addition/repair protein [Paraglaciecola sp.]MDP5041512.1 multifunctional CCA addition/repair protein [Paraglaciecola sp.]MDP5131384.1 multifunctional CCA addition/repair protein [Paraglaciecola sp.]
MQVYLVGGAVRDKLLGLKIKDRDWVVVGATPKQMLDLNYQQVGADFPVFLHPKSKEEYALARTERKTGQGYNGFECYAAQDVTLEQDLLRRDLTINAMALDEHDHIVDPYHGQQDLIDKKLRHVSAAFIEDPLRVFRVARFAARYATLGFTIADETMALMQAICHSGEIQHLSAERVWQETARSLSGPSPEIYIDVLKQCGALNVWFPELATLWGIPNPEKWHPEIDTGVHTLMVLQQAAKLSEKLTVRFAALVHDLGKGLTPEKYLPSHPGHEKSGLSAIKTLCERIKAPNDCRELAMIMSEYHTHVHRAFELKASTIVKMFSQCDPWRKPERFKEFLLACEADARGRTGFENRHYPNADFIWQAYQVALQVDVKAIVESGLKGEAIKQRLTEYRIKAISHLKATYQH